MRICLYYSYGIYHAHAVTRLRSKYRQPYLESGLESDAESDVTIGLESDVESGLENDAESDVEGGLESTEAESDICSFTLTHTHSYSRSCAHVCITRLARRARTPTTTIYDLHIMSLKQIRNELIAALAAKECNSCQIQLLLK